MDTVVHDVGTGSCDSIGWGEGKALDESRGTTQSDRTMRAVKWCPPGFGRATVSKRRVKALPNKSRNRADRSGRRGKRFVGLVDGSPWQEETMVARSYSSYAEFEREEIRPNFKIGFSIDDLEDTSFEAEALLDMEGDDFGSDHDT